MPAKRAPQDRVKKAAAASRANHPTGRTTAKKEAPEITSGSEWAQEARTQRVLGNPLTVPSGKTCLVRRPDSLSTFTDKGMVPNRLMPMIMEAVGGKAVDEATQKKMMSDPELLLDMIAMVDNVVIDCVLQPEIAPIPLRDDGSPILPQQRDDDDTLYVDYIEPEDKFFIFNYALSGVSDVEQFRKETGEGLAPVRAIKAVAQSPE